MTFLGKSGIGKSSLLLIASGSATAILGFVSLGIISSSLGISKLGLYAGIVSLALFIEAFASLQSWQILVNFGPRLMSADSARLWAGLKRVAGVLDGFSVAFGLLIYGIFFFAISFWWPDLELTFTQLLVAASPLLVYRAGSALGLLRVAGRHGIIAASTLGGALIFITLVGFVASYWQADSVTTFVACWSISQAVVKLALVFFSRMVEKRTPFKTRDRATISETIASNPGLISLVVTLWFQTKVRALLQIDTFLVILLAGPQAGGIYAIARTLERLAQRIIGPVNQVTFPSLSHEFASKKRFSQAASEARSLELLLFAILTILALVFAGFGAPLLELFFGPQAGLATLPAAIFLGASAFNALTISIPGKLTLRGRATHTLLATSISSGVFVTLLVLSVGEFGVIAAALSFGIGSVLQWALNTLFIFRLRALDDKGERGVDSR